MDDLIGQTLNRYKILDRVGEGGVGAVYRAYDNILQRDVAIKVMRPEYARQSDFRERFLEEARAVARLDHPSIVKVHDFGQDEDLLYIVMEYIPGNNLREILNNLRSQNQWVILTEAIQIVQQTAQAVEYAHSQGLLHRDIKPENLMLKQEPSNGLPYRIVLTDLGLAKVLLDTGIAKNEIIGTPGYMSPEHALGQQTDARSDVYSLGVLLYELTVGRPPFPAQTISEAVRYHTEEPLTKPRSIRPDLPIALERIILTALERDPINRFESASELNQALNTVSPAVQEAAFIPSADEGTVSLVTQYEHTQASTLPFDGAQSNMEDLKRYHIEILAPDSSIKTVQIKPSGMTIGREEDNDITLNSPKVSRRHARIQHDGAKFWVSDLNSRNGTFLGETRLIPGEPETWTPEKAMKIGDFWLRLRETGARSVPPEVTRQSDQRTTQVENVVASGTSSERVGIFAETVHLSVTPGSSTIATFVVLNKGTSLDHYRVSVEGIPHNWLPSPAPALQILPGGQQEVRLTIQPPQSPTSRPGRYPVTIRVTTQTGGERSAEVRLILTVGVYSRFSSDMRPRRVQSDENIQVTIQNLGNAQDTFTIEMVDQSGELVFHPPQARLSLAEGEVATTELLGSPRNRRLVGGARTNPFTARITASSGENRTHAGELSHSGIIPPVVIPLLLVLCLCLGSLAAYGYFDILARPASARQTAVAETQIAAGTEAALAQANQATIEAATATANWLFSLTLTALPTPEMGTPTETPTPIVIIVTPTPLPETPLPPTPTDTPIVIIVTSTPEPTPVPSPTLPPPTPEPPTPVPAAPTPTPLGGSLLVEFASNRDGNYEIYAMLGDGTAQTRVTNNPGVDDTSPDLTPDFTRTVFVSNRDGNLQIYVMNANGSDQRRISNNNSNDYSPSWSPDGTRIVFVSNRDGNAEIYVMNADGSNQVRLTNTSVNNDNPSWSPDGGRIVFDAINGAGRAIQVMNSDGSGVTALTGTESENFDPAFSPDGQRIAFASNRDGNFELYLMNSNGTNVTRLTNIPQNVAGPNWSRDGQYLTFYTTDPGQSEVYRIRIDGTDLRNLSNTQSNDIEPSW
jgi:eukaryotic-like serine/threonine-protein kinase